MEYKGDANYDVTMENPLHPNTPNSLRLDLEENYVILENEGYWGMAVRQGEKYDLRFYLNAWQYDGEVKVRLVASDKKSILSEQCFKIKKAKNGKNIRLYYKL